MYNLNTYPTFSTITMVAAVATVGMIEGDDSNKQLRV
jgi:hypothetical protein